MPRMPASEVTTGAFTDHFHYERRYSVGLDVLDLQNLFGVLLCHCSQLRTAGYHFWVQQAEITGSEGEADKYEKGV